MEMDFLYRVLFSCTNCMGNLKFFLWETGRQNTRAISTSLSNGKW